MVDKERKFDPVTPAAKDDIRPGFLGSSSSKGRDSGGGGGAEPAENSAVDSLRSAEDAAAGDLSEMTDDADDMRANEQGGGGFYRSQGADTAANKLIAAATRGKVKGVFKKGGPGVAIFLVIFMIGGIIAGTQVFQPFSLIAQFQDNYNSMHISSNRRARLFFQKQMETGRTKNPIKGNKIFGERFSISKKQSQELKKQGIEFDEDYEGSGKKVLKYTDSKGEEKIVTADNFKKVYASDTDFFKRYNAGSMTWRGQFASWYGGVTTRFIKNNNLTRNMWNGWKEKKAAANGDGMRAAKDTMSSRVKRSGDIDARVSTEETEEGNDGKTKHKVDDSKISGTDVKTKMGKIKSKFTGVANAACAVAGVIGTISLMIAADQALQIMTLVTAYTEASDKTKAGYGDDSPIHELAQGLNEKKKNIHTVVESTGAPFSGAASFLGNDGDGGIDTLTTVTDEDTVKDKTAMASEGIASLYSGKRANPYDPSVQSFNVTASTRKILGGFGTGVDAFKTCMTAKIIEDVVIIGLDIFTLGSAALAELAVGMVLSTTLSATIGALVTLLTPVVAAAFERDLIENLGGEDLGNALASGSLMYLGGAHRANGGSLSNNDRYQSYAVAHQQVLAEKAKEERESLSPFDMTSNHTFMGQIMTQMMNLSNSDSLMGALTSAGMTMSSSMSALTPSTAALAKDIADTMPNNDEYGDTCPYLASIGAVGDVFCNPYIITDTATMEDDPADVIDKVARIRGEEQEPSFDNLDDPENDSIVINKKSDLARYISYCDNRTSPFGVTDYNIASEINKSTSVQSGVGWADNIANSFIGSVPVVGDVVDVMESEKNLRNIGYITGESCVAGNDLKVPTTPSVSSIVVQGMSGVLITGIMAATGNTLVDNTSSPNWESAQYYQRFIEDQSLAETMGLVDKSAVSVYLDEYYKENPIDTSYEGMLARYSGLPKDTVVDTLALLEYYNYVAQYDPSERYAFGESGIEIDDGEPEFDNENVLAGAGILLENIVYADVRNQNFAV